MKTRPTKVSALSTAAGGRLTCRNVAASLTPELHDDEGLYKKMKRFGIE